MALTKEDIREMTVLALTTPRRGGQFPKPPPLYVTFSSEEGEFSLRIRMQTLPWDGVVEWSVDKTNWNVFSRYDTPRSENGYLFLRGRNNTHFCNPIMGYESALFDPVTVSMRVTGDIETLLDYQTVSRGDHPNMSRYCFQGMFHNWSGLVEAPKLPAAQLSQRSYSRMFWGCTSLQTAPELPAVHLANACYAEMFRECKSLVEPPVLPAELTSEDEEVYMGMFMNCESLTTLPKLRSIDLPRFCYYNMFRGCKSIKMSTSEGNFYPYAFRIPSEGTAVSVGSSAVDMMFRGTGGPFTGTPSVNTTYYTDHEPV